ncbi:MAG: hypothetical protein SWX82_03800 [Cyanobacteriota bacterium]|nr:hypothetical protein [Cyanobacteriota bacterium]
MSINGWKAIAIVKSPEGKERSPLRGGWFWRSDIASATLRERFGVTIKSPIHQGK